MAVTHSVYGPFDSGPGANITEDTWRKMMRHMLGSQSGVIRGFLNEFQVFADTTGMQVKVKSGECWMRGHYGEAAAEVTLPIAAADATNPRKDRVVLRADFTANRLETDVLTGTPAVTPAAPSLAQNTSKWETSLAIIDVPAADTTIDAGQVTDDRVYTSAHARWQQGTSQTIPATTFTKITWDTLEYRTGDVAYDSTNRRFTLSRSGLWHIVANVRWSNNVASGVRQVTISKDGEESANRQGLALISFAGGQLAQSATALHRYTAGDLVAVGLYQETAGSLTTAVAAKETNISFAWVGP